MGYEFKLEALRRYRKHQEETLQCELGTLQRLCEQAEWKLKETIDRQHRTESDFISMQQEPEFVSQASLYQQFLQRLQNQIEAEKKTLEEAQKACAEKRTELLMAVKKRQILEKLKDNDLKSHIAHLDSEERKFIDEMAVNRFTLNRQ